MPALDVDFHDERISMLHWYPQISALNVPNPKTEFYSLNGAEPSFNLKEGGVDIDQIVQTLENIPVDEIISCIDELPTDKAHIRTDWKASRLAGGEGRKITKDPKVIHEQVIQLIDSMVMTGFPHNALAVREWIDVREITSSYGFSITPEVRFIVDEGTVLGGFVDVYENDFDSSFTKSEIQENLSTLEALFAEDKSELKKYAKRVASELDTTGWSVDFVQDVTGDWYLTDMALYGLYWNQKENRWQNISHIPSGKKYNLEENIPPELNENKYKNS